MTDPSNIAPSGSDMDEGVIRLVNAIMDDFRRAGGLEAILKLANSNSKIRSTIWLHVHQALSTPSPTLTPDAVTVERVECVSYETGFKEPAEPLWRIEINGYCADFETQAAAQNFANAINARSTPAIRDQAFEVEEIEQTISAWAFAHNIDGAARNDLFKRIRALKGTPPSLRSMVDEMDNILRERPETTLSEAVDQARDRLFKVRQGEVK